ncbi:nucleoside hydrolase-like domain-containing protein [Dyadobacter tibetensis]|uniref:nucleoside hydrolase-like domain-containing protein n=1 Tax=Dyadobacter tibetensis TaxID=1211851 RepID=UPI0018DD7A66|nr:nucleoside hydrolase-like domain-containing protein [Dyadobacter tibetensis]
MEVIFKFRKLKLSHKIGNLRFLVLHPGIFVGVVFLFFLSFSPSLAQVDQSRSSERVRVLVTTDGEIDDECSLVRFLLYTNEFDVEGIITSSSQYHWQGHKWAGDNWTQPYLDAYKEVYPNLIQHDARYPSPNYLQSRTLLGNVAAEGEMEQITPGSELIVKVLLDESDMRPIWLQAWGGTNTIARALKTIEEKHPERMSSVASKIRLYLIWEQDETYQNYIKPHWGKYGILTIISDQFIAYFYNWKQFLPRQQQEYLVGTWMNEHILTHHGPLCSLYKAHENGDFRSEGDSPAFFHTIPTGLRSLESPDYGGWGGRYVRVRSNTWMDPVPVQDYNYPEGRWWTKSAWGRNRMKLEIPNDSLLKTYMEPMYRWIAPIQNDFAARADWCVKPYSEANHPPVVRLKSDINITAAAGQKLVLDGQESFDPDGDELSFKWYHDREAGSYRGNIDVPDKIRSKTKLLIPIDAQAGNTIHMIFEVSDSGLPTLTRYQRVVINLK